MISAVGTFLTALAISGTALAGAAVTYHGRILDSNEQAVESPNVTFKIQVRSPGATNCLLYEETRTIDMRNSAGIFVIPIGDGVGQRSSSDPGITIENVFSNGPVDRTGLICNSGSHYLPQALDSRKLIVSFNDGTGSGAQDLPPMDVNYVPLALHSEEASNALNVGSTPAARVMSVASGAATPLSAANFSELLLLVNGNSNAYLKPASIPTCASGQVLKGTAGAFVCVTDASGTDTLAGITCTDGKILKRVSGSWACADESGVGTEVDPTVAAFAKRAPGAGLVVNGSNDLTVDFGTTAGKVAQGNDSRFTDSRAPNGAATGDLSGSYPNPTVKGVRGNVIAATTPLNGQVYQWVNGSTEWQPKFISFADLKKSDGTTQMPATCAANQTLAWSAITDVFSCSDVGSLDASKITTGTIAYARLPVGTAANTVAAGDDSRFTNSRAPNGTAGGELGGTYPNPTVAKLAGVALNVSSLSSGQVLKYDGSNWVNAPDSSGVASEVDPSVQLYAKSAPGTGLKVASNLIVPDFGAGAGKVVEGNDSRLSDNRVASDLNGVVSTGIVQRTGAGSFSTLGASAPITNSGTNIGLAVGSGLTLNSGNLVPDFGTASGKVAQGNDSRFPSSTCASGTYNRWNGSAWACDADNATDPTKVAKGGDTMTGMLNLPADGLVVGSTQLVAHGGVVGIGTSSPGANLDIAGAGNPVLSVRTTGTGGVAHFIGHQANGGTYPTTAMGLATFQGRSTMAGNAVWPGMSVLAAENWSASAQGSVLIFSTSANGTTTTTEQMRIAADGNVGIGSTNPVAKLDVNGGIRLGTQSTCDGTTEGSQRYNSTSKLMEFCNGTAWTAMGGGAAAEPVALAPRTSAPSGIPVGSGAIYYKQGSALTSDANTVLLVDTNSTNNSTTFTDISSYGKSISRTGTVAHTTSTKVYGTTSLSFDGASYLSVSDSPDFAISSADSYTIESWVYLNNNTSSSAFYSQTYDGSNWWEIGFSSSYNMYYTFYCGSNNGGNHTVNSGYKPPANQWFHVAWVKSGSSVKLYVNGTVIIQTTWSGNCDISGPLKIGWAPYTTNNSTASYMNGYLDEIRFSKGIARQPSDFGVSGLIWRSKTGAEKFIILDD